MSNPPVELTLTDVNQYSKVVDLVGRNIKYTGEVSVHRCPD